MELVMFGGDAAAETAGPSDDDLFTFFDPSGDQEPLYASPVRQPSVHSQTGLSHTLWRSYLNEDSNSESDSELSEQEWEHWMADLPQRVIHPYTAEQPLRLLSTDIEEAGRDEDDIAWVQEPPSELPPSDEGGPVTSIAPDNLCRLRSCSPSLKQRLLDLFRAA
ncbi:hypothetical protein C8Q72DRAFT_634948 [Fomitopsis betulina]|nr:hypothetical protein C8Q72DRAFT_634948 [Fomitopsis betulina]